MSVPSFFNDLARISEPVSSAITPSLPSCSIWSTPRPSHSRKTSFVCCPSSGAGLTSGVHPPKRTGQPGVLNGPTVGCSIVCTMPRRSKSATSVVRY